jgi:hypothetical protein
MCANQHHPLAIEMQCTCTLCSAYVLTFQANDGGSCAGAGGVGAGTRVLASVALLQVGDDEHAVLVDGSRWQQASVLGPGQHIVGLKR